MNWNAIIWFGWLGLFAVLEGLALAKRAPWSTLSDYAWKIEKAQPVTRPLFAIGLAALLTHIVVGWPA